MNPLSVFLEIRRLERIRIQLGDSEEALRLRKEFSKPHPRYCIIPNKRIGVELIKSFEFESPEAYLASVNGKNSAAYFSRKAARAGYSVRRFDPNGYIDPIYAINTSKPMRQGQLMTEGYTARADHFTIDDAHPWFGVFSREDKLCGYVCVSRLDEVVLVNRILGHGDHLANGVMYLLGTTLVQTVISERLGRYLMYDMYFGAKEGLRLYKGRLGFRPYWVTWL